MIKLEDLKWKESSYIIWLILLLVLGLFLSFLKEYTVAFFFVTLGFAIFTIGLSFKAIYISKESDEKMKAIANADFIELIEKIWDYSDECSIKENDDVQSYHSRNNILKWRINIKRANVLKKWADVDKQKALGIALEKLLKEFPWKSNLLTNKDIEHMMDICKDIVEFEMLDEKEISEILETYFGKNKAFTNIKINS